MGRKPNEIKASRFRFSCPENDEQVLDWIDKQHSLSASLRVIIKDYIRQNGMNDATCLPVIANDKGVVQRKRRSKQTIATQEPETKEKAVTVAEVKQPVAQISTSETSDVEKTETPNTENPNTKASNMLFDMLK